MSRKRLRIRKGGRPKSPPKPKEDLGTNELRSKRMQIVGTKPNDVRDMTLSTCPIDVLLARRMISEEAHQAAHFFAALRKIVFGKAHPGAVDILAITGGRPEESDSARAEFLYREACTAMKLASRQAFDAVENLVVHERYPEWMGSGKRGPRISSRRHFGLGMAALLAWQKGRERRAA